MWRVELFTSTTEVWPVNTVIALITRPSFGVVLMSHRHIVYIVNIHAHTIHHETRPTQTTHPRWNVGLWSMTYVQGTIFHSTSNSFTFTSSYTYMAVGGPQHSQYKSLSLWCPVICNFWHPGALMLSYERQSARMSKIANDGLTRSGTGCFMEYVPIWQQCASKG